MHIARCILILGIVCSPCFAGPNTNDVPSEIAGVSLGMDWKAFLALGRYVEVMNAMPDKANDLTLDPDHPKRALTEKLKKGPFDRVIYGFENGKLTSIMIGGQVKKEWANRTGFLRRVLSQYGVPDTVGIMRSQKGHGVLKWHRNHAQIRAILPATNEVGLVSIQVLSDSVAEQIENAEKTQSRLLPSGENDGTDTLTAPLHAEVRAVLDEVAKTKPTPQQ